MRTIITIDLSEESERVVELKTTLRHVSIPDKEFIEKVFSILNLKTIKPFMPIRDLSLYDTMIYIATRHMILSGGYGINACFFSPDERRLSLADIDFVSISPDIDEIIAEINDQIIKNNGAAIFSLGKHKTSIGLISLNTKKMQWLRRIGAENVYSYRRTILLPPIGHYALRGEMFLDYLKRHGFSEEKEWQSFVLRAKKIGIDRFRVETIEIDITVMDANYVIREAKPAFEIAGGEKYITKKRSVMVIEPKDAVNALKGALFYFFNKKQTHNTVKTLIDLRLAKIMGEEKKLSNVAKKIASKKEFLKEYESGKESWRFAILRIKYTKLSLLIDKWF